MLLAGYFTLIIAPDAEEDPEERTFPDARLPAIIIDAGHGGKDDGAQWHAIREKDLTRTEALELERVLNARGFPTVQTRTEDVFVSLPDRAAIANHVHGPAVFISVHFNQGSEEAASGIETFYADTKVPPVEDWTWIGFFSNSDPAPDTGEELAAQVQLAVIHRTGARDRGVRPRHLYVTRHTRVPAILIEGGFITNNVEAHLLNTPGYIRLLAEGVADGVEAWWRVQQHPPPPMLARRWTGAVPQQPLPLPSVLGSVGNAWN